MGVLDFFKNIFGKKTCAFCGGECGMLSRTKIKNDEFICNKCDDGCSRFIRKSRYTKEELQTHMDYIAHLDRVYTKTVVEGNIRPVRCPSDPDREGIEFIDEIGMFRVIDVSADRSGRYPVELIRYDQIAAWEPYLDESESEEDGKKEMVFGECGIELTLVGTDHDKDKTYGTMAHPYITEPIRICFTTDDDKKEDMLRAIRYTVRRLENIFGVHDDDRALIQIGMTDKEKRDLMAGVALAKAAFTAVKVAKNGEESLSDEEKAALENDLHAVDDAQTNGLAQYTRRADAVLSETP